MVFSSLIFLYIFLPIVLLIYYACPRGGKNFCLLVASLIFYAWGEPVYVLGIVASVIFNYFFGIILEKHRKKYLLAINIFFNLAYLGFFKYTDFAIGTMNKLFGTDISLLKIALPIGISFYTFQALSYTIDVYRGEVKAGRNIIDFGTYITMFPQLIAGPIVRYKTIALGLRTRKETMEDLAEGVVRFATGLGKKVLIANSIGQIWDTVRTGALEEMTTAAVWIGMVSFTLQIYFDFSGYSDMAIGLGRMFGFRFNENFDRPYISRSITEFWRRWHISLSTWFKEYVYIPLGGNRKGTKRQLINLFIVWTLTGLWHGAAWTFVAWGLYYGILLIIEKLWLGKLLDKLPGFISWIYTILIVILGWGIFGLADVTGGHRREFVSAIVGQGVAGLVRPEDIYLLTSNAVVLIVAAVISTGIITKIVKKYCTSHKGIYAVGSAVYVVIIMLISTVCIVADTYNPFLYFRF